jgi:hypothetical protein
MLLNWGALAIFFQFLASLKATLGVKIKNATDCIEFVAFFNAYSKKRRMPL